MNSFRSFVASDPGADPATAAQRYEEYQVSYLASFSSAFFDATAKEEWFRDRYDPLRRRETEADTATWSQQQSLAFATQFLCAGGEAGAGGVVDADALLRVVASMRLNPDAAAATPSAGGGGEGSTATPTAAGGAEGSTVEGAEQAAEVEVAAPAVVAVDAAAVDGRHVPGHAGRAIYVTGIPANCPKQVFREAVLQTLAGIGQQESEEADAAAAPSPLVDRVVMAQPAWNKYKRFERTAWIVLHPAGTGRASVDTALHALKAAGEVVVPGPVNPTTGDVNLRQFVFTPSYMIHTPRATTVHGNVSGSARVKSDELAARKMANYLDEQRAVPLEQRLHTLLTEVIEPNTVIASGVDSDSDSAAAPIAGDKPVLLPTDLLDMSIAYLRSVHFASYYDARRFLDEAHMLSQAPFVTARAHPYYLFVPRRDHQDSVTVGGATGKRSRDEAEGTDEGAGQAEAEAPAEREAAVPVEPTVPEGAVSGAMDAADSPHPALPDISCRQLPRVQYIDRRAQGLLWDLHLRAYNVRQRELEGTDPFASASDIATEAAGDSSAAAGASTEGAGATPGRAPKWDTQRDVDDEDASAIAAENERVLNEWSEGLVNSEKPAAVVTVTPTASGGASAVAKPATAEEGAAPSRARCGLKWCNKLFKGADFVKKHVRSKHEDLASGLVLAVARPYMQRRFEAEDLLTRPLPPVPVEGQNRHLESWSVQDVLERCPRASNLALLGIRPPQNRDKQQRGGRGGDTRERQRDNRGAGDGRQRGSNRGSFDGRDGGQGQGHGHRAPAAAPPEPPAPYVHPNPGQRQLPSYMDVDAPQVSFTFYVYVYVYTCVSQTFVRVLDVFSQ